jgi:hypothetical protein
MAKKETYTREELCQYFLKREQELLKKWRAKERSGSYYLCVLEATRSARLFMTFEQLEEQEIAPETIAELMAEI